MESEDERPEVHWSARERAVLDLLAADKTNGEIAESLGISFATAKWHVSEVLTKLGVESRTEAARYWRRERGLLGRARRGLRWIAWGAWLKAGAGGVALVAAGVAIGFVVTLGRGGATTPASPSQGSTATTAADEWAPLRRPLRLPAISPGGPCPVSTTASHTPAYGAGAGAGPFFVAGMSAAGVVEYSGGGEFTGSDWGGQKTLRYADPAAYQGRALIRGVRIDGPGEVRFTNYIERQDLATALQVDTSTVAPQPSSTWPSWIGYTRIRLDSPGCYGFQVDGVNFTEIIVFQAVRAVP